MTGKLEQILSKGIIARPQAVFAYGLEGTRKTGSLVSPKSLIIDLERGSDQYDVERISVGTYAELIKALDLVIHEKSSHEVVVVDPIEIAEKLQIAETCRQLRIDGLQGLPHGAAYQYQRENFDAQFMSRFEQIRRTGRHIAIIGHAQVRTVTLPGLADPFDRWESRLDKRNADGLAEWADHVLFYNWDLRTAKSRDGSVRAIAGRDPIIHVVHGPGWNAKNRAGLVEPLKPEFAALAPLFGATTPPPPPSRPDREAAAGAARQAGEVKTVADPDQEPVDPLLSPVERRDVEKILDALPQDKLLKFLRDRELITRTQDRQMLGPTYLRRILANPQNFKDAVLK